MNSARVKTAKNPTQGPRRRTSAALWLLAVGAVASACNATHVPAASTLSASLPALVNAGADFQTLTGAPACLDASHTYHPLGTIYFLTWSQTAGEVVTLDDPGSRRPCFLAPLEEQTLNFDLVANDGLWLATDSVQVQVRQNPNATAPLVRGGPDRFAARGGSQIPEEADVLAADPNMQIVWETLVAQAAPNPSSQVVLASAALMRLTGHTADGLDALPDYVLLWPYDDSNGGRRAPTVELTGTQTTTAGGLISLDASKSADAYGDALRWHWTQSCGSGAFIDPGSVQQTALSAAMRPERQCLRVTVRDSLLESAPAELAVTVTLPTGHATAALAPVSFTTHAGNALQLDADPAGQNPNTLTYSWQQTFGPTVDTSNPAGDGARRLNFTAPGAGNTLAFAVSATDSVVDSGPAVAVVRVLGDADNAAPQVALCAESTTPAPGSTVTLYASAADPEQDAVDPILTWSDTPSITPQAPGPRPAACPLPAAPTGGSTQAYEASFTAPASGEAFTISVKVCDKLAACGTADLAMQVP